MSPSTGATQTDAAASTFKWDTVFAIRVDDVNKTIAAKGTSPDSFHAESPKIGSITGKFGNWEICKGGSGKNLRMKIPILTLEFTRQEEVESFQGITATIELSLHYVPHMENATSVRGGSLVDLIVKHQKDHPDDLPVVSVVHPLKFSAGNPEDELTVDFLEVLIDQWFNAHLSEFGHVFATVNLNCTADSEQFQWLMPTYTSYAYAERETLEDCMLGILCMTRGRSPTGLVEELSAAAIPIGARAGFLISKNSFLEEILLPALPYAFKGSMEHDFTLSADGQEVTVQGKGSVKLADVRVNGETYPTELDELQIKVQETNVLIKMLTKTTVSPGIYAHCQHTAAQCIGLHKTSDGTQSLKFFPDPAVTPHTDHWTSKDPDTVVRVIEAVVAAIVSAVIIVATEGTGTVVAMLIVGLLLGTAEIAPKIIETLGTDKAPSIDLLVLNSTDPITWPDAAHFSLTWAGLNDSLQLGGDPNFDRSSG